MTQLSRQQFLPISPEVAWNFFSNPTNLALITPPKMGFIIHSALPPQIYTGLQIHYTIRPLFGIPVKWVTEIMETDSPHFFVDEQRKGPYAYWRHEHRFVPKANGVLMTDHLQYRIGKSLAGWVAGKIFVHQSVMEIFDFRFKKLEQLFKNG